MHSTKRTTRNFGMAIAIVASGLLLASLAEAGERHRGERIDHRLDFFALVAAFSGDHVLAVALDRRGDRIEHAYAHSHGHHRHGLHARSAHRLHYAGCGHAVVREHFSDRHRSHRRDHRDRPHRRHREKRDRH